MRMRIFVRGLKRLRAAALGAASAVILTATPASGMDLKEALSTAVNDNPDIGEAIESRRATFLELEQARGLYLPQVDLEANIGPEMRDNRTTRAAGTDNDWFNRRDLSLTLQQLIWDGGGTDAEYERQAARVDAASYRVMERTEFVGLDVTESYLNVLRQLELAQIAQENVRFHERMAGDIGRQVRGGVGRASDDQQARERLEAARVTSVEIARSLDESRNRFRRLVGVLPDELVVPGTVTEFMPETLDGAIVMAREGNPSIKSARADLDTARAEYDAADARFYPRLSFEMTGRAGEDLDGDGSGRDNDVRALLVLRYNIFRGGIDSANLQEQVHRQGEAAHRLSGSEREVEELARNAWDGLERARERRALLEKQVEVSSKVLSSYRAEFTAGNRSLLDILDAQNSLVGAQVDLSTARYAELFAEYRMLAVAGRLMSTVGVSQPAETTPFRPATAGSAE